MKCARSQIRLADAAVKTTRYSGVDGVTEAHFCVEPAGNQSFDQQLSSLEKAYDHALAESGLPPSSAVFRRIFVRDLPARQKKIASSGLVNGQPVAVSVVDQPPLNGADVSLWAYHVHDPNGIKKERQGSTLSLARGELRHLWTTGLVGVTSENAFSAYDQTRRVIQDYTTILDGFDATLRSHAVRTWVFVRDIDHDYDDMVLARKEIYGDEGLTERTHYIASTGIAGGSSEPSHKVMLDAYAIAGLKDEQIRHLYAPDFLSRTIDYGVTFERGTAIDYRDRRHVMISGTASIDQEGRVLHVGDLLAQLERTLANIEALLSEAKADFGDVAQMIVYLREAGDRNVIQNELERRLPDVPWLLVLAPVCRQTWLVEIECMAVVDERQQNMPPF